MTTSIQLAGLNGTALPSQDAADRLVRGEPNGLRDSVGSTMARACLIGAGLYFCGRRGKPLVRESLAAATAVELFVVGWCWSHK